MPTKLPCRVNPPQRYIQDLVPTFAKRVNEATHVNEVNERCLGECHFQYSGAAAAERNSQLCCVLLEVQLFAPYGTAEEASFTKEVPD